MARFARIDSQIRTNRLIRVNRLGVPELNPLFGESRSGHQKLRIAGLRRFARIARTSEENITRVVRNLAFARKKRCFWAFSAHSPMFGAKAGTKKTRAQPWHARKSGKSPGQERHESRGFPANRAARSNSRESPRFALRSAGPSKVSRYCFETSLKHCKYIWCCSLPDLNLGVWDNTSGLCLRPSEKWWKAADLRA